MADYTWYVDPAATGSNNGTDWTNAYTSLNACEAAKNSLTGTDTMTVNCRSSGAHPADTAAVTWDGSTTTGTITINVDQADRAVGKVDTSKYRLLVDAAWGHSLLLSDPVTIYGIQAKNSSANGSSAISITVGGCILIGCIGYGQGRYGTPEEFACLLVGYDISTTIFINCIGTGASASGFLNRSSNSRFYNCVAVNNGEVGFEGVGYRTTYLINCYAGGNTGYDCNDASANVVFNITSSASEDGTFGSTVAYTAAGTTGTQFTNITAGSEDVHIASASQLKDAGTNPSAGFTTDIDGDTISTWMIGCDYYVSTDAGVMEGRKKLRKHFPDRWPAHVFQ